MLWLVKHPQHLFAKELLTVQALKDRTTSTLFVESFLSRTALSQNCGDRATQAESNHGGINYQHVNMLEEEHRLPIPSTCLKTFREHLESTRNPGFKLSTSELLLSPAPWEGLSTKGPCLTENEQDRTDHFMPRRSRLWDFQVFSHFMPTSEQSPSLPTKERKSLPSQGSMVALTASGTVSASKKAKASQRSLFLWLLFFGILWEPVETCGFGTILASTVLWL